MPCSMSALISALILRQSGRERSRATSPGRGVSPPAAVVSYDLSTTKVQCMVGVSDLDTQYKWTVKRTIDQFIPATLRENFALFEKYPDYVFSFEGSFRYLQMKEHYPREYEELKRWVAKGNWAIAGSMVDAPDVNMPCPESLIRRVLYGNLFFEDEFNKKSICIFLPDCFGFTYALPSIAAHCGLKGFSACKLDWGSARDIPFDLGVWEGPDGTSVVAALKPGKYNSRQWHIHDEAIAKLCESSNVRAAYGYFGVGDQGGAVEEQYVQSLCESMSRNDQEDIKVISVSSDQLFRDITGEQIARLPVYKGEFLMRTHGVGTYSHRADVKWRNHEAEQKAMAAEKVASAAQWASHGLYSYPSDDLKESWIHFLWRQMHDDLTGTSISEAYTYTRPGIDSAIAKFSEVTDGALEALAEQMDTRTGSAGRIPVVVFNTVSRDRVDMAEVAVTFPGSAPAAVRVYDGDGEEVPSQVDMFVLNGNADRVVRFPAAGVCGATMGRIRNQGTSQHHREVYLPGEQASSRRSLGSAGLCRSQCKG